MGADEVMGFQTEAEVVKELTIRAFGVQTPVRDGRDGVPFIVMPEGCTIGEIESMLPSPLRIKNRVQVETPEDFVTYFARFAGPGAIITVDTAGACITCTLDYSEDADTPAWGDHMLVCQPKEDWRYRAWSEISGRYMEQTPFAEWLEDRVVDVAVPDAADLLEVASTLQAKKELTFRSAVRLDNGTTQLQCDETLEATAGKGAKIDIPQQIVIGVPVFANTAPVRIDARLRYRVERGTLRFAIVIADPKAIREKALQRVVDVIRTGVQRDPDQPQVPILRGSITKP